MIGIPFKGQHRLLARSDVIANILFFMPLGILLALRKILRYYRNFTFADWTQIFLTGFTVSFVVEFLQLLTFDRHTSVTDLLTNTLGNILGALLMLIIYLRFHARIKSLLFYLFAGKPEMSIAAMFLIFICISYSIPFTFQPSLISVKTTFRILIENQIQWKNFWYALPVQLIVFGTFSFLLFLGVYRYFGQIFNSSKKYVLIVALSFIPIFLELFQLFIPIRNHALSDILAAEVGILTGLSFFLFQKYVRFGEKTGIEIPHKIYNRAHIEFFQFMAIIYLLSLYSYFTFFEPLYASADNFHDLFIAGGKKNFQILKYKRLNLLIHFTKEVFTFLPAGFILSLLMQGIKGGWKIGIFVLILLVTLFLALTILKPFPLSYPFLVLSFTATALGFWFGYISWEVYKYLMRVP
ncbi:MAG: VanZ family protein [bacterium]|nr:MAG: VanZ family protein [bacterium]